MKLDRNRILKLKWSAMSSDGQRIEGDFEEGTRAPGIRLNAVRYVFRDPLMSILLKVMLLLVVAGVCVAIFWNVLAGAAVVLIALLPGMVIWRSTGIRKVEFMDALLSPGIVISKKPLQVLVLSDMANGDIPHPVWAVKLEDCRSLRPLSSEPGTHIPCVTAFHGSGEGGSWDEMVCNPLTAGTGNRAQLDNALARLDVDVEVEWDILEAVAFSGQLPKQGQTLLVEVDYE